MLSSKDAQSILDSVHFPADTALSATALRDAKLAAAPKSLRRTLIKEGGGSSEVRSAAAIEIQRAWRGYWARCRVFAIVNPRVSRQANPTQSRVKVSRHSLKETIPSPLAENSMSRLERCYQKYYNNRVQSGEEDDIATFEDFCANYIQNWWFRVKKGNRVTLSRSSFKSPKIAPGSMKAVRIMQRDEGSHHSASSKASTVKSVKKVRTKPLDRMEAAMIIQRGWRRHIDVQVYKYYRDLINFRNRGDPAMMLRCVNPKETPLLDAASGVHVKFRLAGERFPPNIYYKIFTHRPIQDLCANSPKDYTRPEAKLKMMKDVHNKHDKRIQNVKIGWYQRMDNNGWRLVSDRLLQRIDSDPVTWESAHRKINFHHDKLKRRQDVEKKRKRKKVDWMKKMYREGMLKAKSDDKETISLIEGAAQGMVETIEAEGPDVIEEWEVDELLDWTNALNFDDYLTAWKEVATSANSEASAEEALKLSTNKADPFQFTITAGRTPPLAPSPSRATTIPSAHISRPSPVSQLSAGTR